MRERYIYPTRVGIIVVVKIDITKLWSEVRGLGAPEIIRRAAEAAGRPRDEVARRAREKTDELAIVTDEYAAFLVACEVGAAEKIADGREQDGARPECSTATNNLRASLGSVVEARARVVVTRERKEKRGGENAD